MTSTPPTRRTFTFDNYLLTSGSSYWLALQSAEAGGSFDWAYNTAGLLGTAQNSSGWSPATPRQCILSNR